MKKFASLILIIFAFSTVASLFQNCAKVRFETSQASSKPDPVGTLDQPTPLHCEFNGETLNEGDRRTAFQNSSVAFGETCVSETRICKDGHLSGTYSYASCDVNGPKSCFFNGRTIPHQGTVDAFQNSSVAYDASCVKESRVCNNGELSGSYQFGTCEPAAPASCLFNGQNIAHGQSVVAYQNGSVAYGEECQKQVRVCTNGTLSGTYSHASCEAGLPKSCLFNGRSIAHGEQVTAYLNPSESYGHECSVQTRTCNNGVLSGTYNYEACTVGAPDSCRFNGQTIAHGQEVTAFRESAVPYGEACVGQTRRCDNGVLSGRYRFASCNVGEPEGCLFNGRLVAHGESVTGYFDSRVPFGSTCRSTTRICNNGEFSGDGSPLYATCEVDGPAACHLNGETIAHGERVIAFRESSVAFGETCEHEERICTNGVLSGSFKAKSCDVDDPRTCRFKGQTIEHGSRVRAFSTPNVPFGESCQSEDRTCQNGVLSGSYEFANCFVKRPKNCEFQGQTIKHGEAVQAFESAGVGYGETCKSETRTCNDGVLSGTYQNRTCTVAEPRSCNFKGRKLKSGEKITAYASPKAPYGERCESEERVCQDGVLSGSYEHLTCEESGPKDCEFNGQVVKHHEKVRAYKNSSVPFGAHCQSEERVCQNGKLTGQFEFATCKEAEAKSCELEIQAVQRHKAEPGRTSYLEFVKKKIILKHGESITLYDTGENVFKHDGDKRGDGDLCADVCKRERVCNNGKVSGADKYVYETCRIRVDKSKSN
jgi:hypothetical protein